MKKMMSVIAPTVALGCLAATSVMFMKNKKTMLDVIIEEIETSR